MLLYLEPPAIGGNSSNSTTTSSWPVRPEWARENSELSRKDDVSFREPAERRPVAVVSDLVAA